MGGHAPGGQLFTHGWDHGMWQVSGRNANVGFEEWMQLDLEYIDTWSLWLDIKILFKTVPVVLLHKGAS